MSDRHDLNISAGPLPVNQNEGKLTQQESARVVRAACPALGSLHNLGERTINFCVELEGGVRAALKMPVKRRIVFRAGFLVKF